jgi:hypothetical protein
VTVRTYTCVDCPPGSCTHTAGARGPLPTRCPDHRRARDLRRERRRRSPLRVVQDGETAPPPPADAAPEPLADAAEASTPSPPGTIREALDQDLAAVFSKHPAARTLERIAATLATVLDSPIAVIADPKIVPPLSRELRAIVHELVTHQEAEEDDLFGGAGPVAVGGG